MGRTVRVTASRTVCTRSAMNPCANTLPPPSHLGLNTWTFLRLPQLWFPQAGCRMCSSLCKLSWMFQGRRIYFFPVEWIAHLRQLKNIMYQHYLGLIWPCRLCDCEDFRVFLRRCWWTSDWVQLRTAYLRHRVFLRIILRFPCLLQLRHNFCSHLSFWNLELAS